MRRTTLLASFSLATALHATTFSVPVPYSTIQSAINASADGDSIIVAPGTYFENINFRGKNVVLTSLYYLAGDTTYISNTIINGSTPVHADTASCVIFNSGEDSTCVLQGFTITGGAGTRWADIHGAGIYREGGGILIELSSPTITHNVIRNNSAINVTGASGAGGGGIRVGDSNPTICSNEIINNQGKYGPGIVLNYTGAKIRNNIIASNTGGQNFYGGSGIWILENLGTTPKIIENNTIVNNFSTLTATGTGGISAWMAGNVIIRNNIIYGNLPAAQIKNTSSVLQVTYNDIQGGYSGMGNINQDPMFDATGYLLGTGSPCIDKGDSSIKYNDIENTSSLGNALFPSKGTLRNDIGAYGGPCAAILPGCVSATAVKNDPAEKSGLKIIPNPATDLIVVTYDAKSKEPMLYEIFDITGQLISSCSSARIDVSSLTKGLYLIRVTDGQLQLTRRFVKD